jgi:hypothetical protein
MDSPSFGLRIGGRHSEMATSNPTLVEMVKLGQSSNEGGRAQVEHTIANSLLSGVTRNRHKKNKSLLSFDICSHTYKVLVQQQLVMKLA